ncbi:transposase [Streptomyces actuosus]|uniref:Transposase n=1 Tax=Streptomyces actuosus TaxID=1885 RepID=A0ABS2W179_STRAS|nr:transposase [Streptomyces actuosus]MBN0049039.1 transposase [Streptomyces actuosus]
MPSLPARDQLFRLRLAHPQLAVAGADSAFGGTLVDWSHTFLGITLKTGPGRKDQDGFAVLAKRWRVERAIAWIMRVRRSVRDHERPVSHSEAQSTWTFITLTVRRLTPSPTTPHVATPRRTGREERRQAQARTPAEAGEHHPARPGCSGLTPASAPAA